MLRETTSGFVPLRQDVLELVTKAIGLIRSLKHVDFHPGTGLSAEASRLARQSRMLYEVNENDSIAVEGALFSAVFELSAKASLRLKQDPLSNADLAVAFDLIRVAYNRAQRSMRHDARIRMEATRGETTAGDSNLRPIDVIRENSAIFSAQIRELLDGIYGDLDEREQRVIDSLSQGMTVDEVALCEGVYRTTISRVVKRLSDRIRRCLIDG